jgi:prepilin-type N-terminal cleavage/methylation domain-containing protein
MLPFVAGVPGQDGFTMVEVVMAIFIFGLVITGVTVGMTSSLNLTRQNRNRSIAANLASQEMDTVRSTDFTDIALGQVKTTQSVDGVAYTITREASWVSANAASGPCQAPSGSSLAYLSVRVSVSWQNMQGVKPPISDTVITPPVGTYDPNSGHVAVTVRDAAGQPQPSVPVTFAGGSVNATQNTTSDGCAFFAYEPAGSYTVTLSSPGYVSDQGVASPSTAATVVAGSTVPLQFQYDRAASIVATLQPTGGAPLPTSPSIPVSLGNTHILPTGFKTVAGGGATRTIGSLFPFADGYAMWAGACSDADPQGIKPAGGPYYPGATRDAAVAVTPGGSSAGTVTLPALTVQTLTTASLPRPNVAVTATHVVPSGVTVDPSCTSGATYALGTTDASGRITVGLPYGTWMLSAAGTSTTAQVTLDPTAASPPVTISW